MATILAHISVKTGQETRFEKLARNLFRSSHDLESGLLRYEYWRGQQVGTYYTLLSFKTYENFLSHQISPHHEEAARELGEVIANLRLEWLDPLEGASDLPSAQPSEMTSQMDESANPALRRAARMFPIQMGSWWPSAGQGPAGS
jgi:quinol monooxygenase YgiN